MNWLLPLLAMMASHLGFECHLSLSHETLPCDDQLSVELTLDYPVGFVPDIDALKERLPLRSESFQEGAFTLIDEVVSLPQVREESGRVTQSVCYVLEPWSPGVHTLAFMPITFYSMDGQPHEAGGQLATLQILESEGDGSCAAHAPLMPFVDRPTLAPRASREQLISSELAETEQRVGAALAQRKGRLRFLLYFLASLGAALLGFKLFRMLSKGRGHSMRRNPRAHALSALQALQREGLPDKGHFDLYYVRLTGIVRTFVEDTYEIRAPELTTEEFLAASSSSSLGDAFRRGMQAFLLASDLVKFAALTPSIADCQGAYLSAHELITKSSEERDQREESPGLQASPS